uniref:Uncharacterized protein n=1 Tax=Anguilla anguilla TaxID=7936 RepID=A0A0E9WG40_ANGAN
MRMDNVVNAEFRIKVAFIGLKTIHFICKTAYFPEWFPLHKYFVIWFALRKTTSMLK